MANPLAEAYRHPSTTESFEEGAVLSPEITDLLGPGQEELDLSSLSRLQSQAKKMQERLKKETIIAELADASGKTGVLMTGDQEVKYLKINDKDYPELVSLINSAIRKTQMEAAKTLLEISAGNLPSLLNIIELQERASKMQEMLEKLSLEVTSTAGDRIVIRGDQHIEELSIAEPTRSLLIEVLNRAIKRSQEMAARILIQVAGSWSLLEIVDEETQREAEPDLNRALAELADRGLVQINLGLNMHSYDLHPIVRAYVYEEMSKEEKKITQIKKRLVFEATIPVDITELKTISNLQREMEIYHSYLETGESLEALNFFITRLFPILTVRLGRHTEASTLFEPLLKGIEELVEQFDPDLQVRIFETSAATLRFSKSVEGRKHSELAVLKALASSNRKLLVDAIRLLSLSYMDNQEIYRSIRTDSLNLRLAQGMAYDFGVAETYIALFYRYMYTGQWESATDYFQRAQKAIAMLDPEVAEELATVLWRYNAQLALDRGEDEPAYLGMIDSHRLSDMGADEEQMIVVLRGEFALRRGELDTAVYYFNRLLDFCQETMQDHKNALGGLARAHLAKKNKELARAFTEKGADDLSAAEVWLALGDKNKARQAALKAYKESWADGPPYSWWYGLRKASEILKELGEPMPDLLTFDEKTELSQSIYCETEILAIIEALEAGKQDQVERT
jgi:tetratricopeptide (TPR) repeat protein